MSPRTRYRRTRIPAPLRRYEDPWNRLLIDLDAIEANYRELEGSIPRGSVLYAVLKSDAYGHGLEAVASVLAGAGCRHFAVETPRDAIRLRLASIDGDILLMNPVPVWMAQLCVRYELTVSVIHPSIVGPLEEAAEALDTEVRTHINVNVGLNRLGASASKSVEIARAIDEQPRLSLEGIYGQPGDPGSAPESFERLEAVGAEIRDSGIDPGRIHFSNSVTMLTHPGLVAGGVRVGILLYGVLPPEIGDPRIRESLRPAMSLLTEIVQIRKVPKGSRIGYRSRNGTGRELTVATIPVGFHHGLSRKLATGGSVLVNGARAPFVGAISMNSATIDVTAVEHPRIGDRVTVVGRQGDQEIAIDELANHAGTISAELMMSFGRGIAKSYARRQDGAEQVPNRVFRDSGPGVEFHVARNERELPEGVEVSDVTAFLRTHLPPFDDPVRTITIAVDHALASVPEGRGFVLLAVHEGAVIGAAVVIELLDIGIIPENLIVYVCVHPDFRRKGLGSRLVEAAVELCDGDVKLHVDRRNPAVAMYRKLGFTDDYFEMRYLKERL